MSEDPWSPILAISKTAERARVAELRGRMLGRGTRRPGGQSICIFLRSLALMLRCGIRINSALSMLAHQGDDFVMRRVSQGLVEEVERGNPLSRAMYCYPNAFQDFHVSLVVVGEKSGSVEKVLYQLADYEEKTRAMTMRVKSALTYPFFVFVVATLMLLFAPPYLFAGIFPILQSSGTELPWLTRALIAFSTALRDPKVLVAGGLCLYALGQACIYALTFPATSHKIQARLLDLPVVGRAVRIIAVARFARSLSMQMQVGCDLLPALRAAARATQHPILIRTIEIGVKEITNGSRLSVALARTEFFPGIFLSVLAAGEEIGELADLMEHLSHFFEQEIETAVETLSALLEPIIMFVMGILVGTMLIAVLLPLSRTITAMS